MEPIPLESWAIFFLDDDPFLPPEAQRVALVGRRPDGAQAVLPQGDADVEGRIVTFEGQSYRLGEPEGHCTCQMDLKSEPSEKRKD